MKLSKVLKIKKSGIAVAVVLVFAATLFSCNKETGHADMTEVTSSSVAVEKFNLKAMSTVMSNLDSVFFSIDLNRGVIFNADSLPKGTNITKLIPVIKLTDVKEAKLTMTGGELLQGEIDYLKNPADTVDFTGKVNLHVVSLDGLVTKDYEIKVNVHKMDPDSLMWGEMAMSKLPSRLANPVNQRTVSLPDASKTYSLIEETDGTHTLSIATDPELSNWEKKEVTLPDGSDIRSFCIGTETMYLRDKNSNLHTSTDGMTWTLAETGWISLLGAYMDAALGVKQSGDGRLLYATYPEIGFPETEMADEFPLYNTSNLTTFSSKWSSQSIVFFAGGETLDGKVSEGVWGFDGDQWTMISLNAPIATKGSVVVPYYTYIKTSALWVQTEITAWLMIGGQKADGTLNRDVYVSYDTGVNWHKGSSLVQLPDYIPSMKDLDQVVSALPKEGNLNNWQRVQQAPALPAGFRIAYKLDGYEVEWECPYIYLFGGVQSNGRLSDDIWRGVLNRLTFTPII